MALLGMQADMQYKSYFPGHYSTMDLNLDANGSIWPVNNIDRIFMNGHSHDGALLLPFPYQLLVQNKAALKQTMLKHEAIFKDQIRELHRLYWRQRELMDEMKIKLLKHHLRLETLSSNPQLSKNSHDYAQKLCHAYGLPQMNPACNRLSVSTTENDLPLSCFKEGNIMYAGPEPAQTKFSACVLEPKCKKFSKKILDLELPPDEYIDSEEEECLPKAPTVLDHPPNKIVEAVDKSNQQPYHGSSSFNSALRGDNLTPSSISDKRICLADLNEPVKLEEEADSTSIYVTDLNKPTKHEEEAAPKFKILANLNEPIKLKEETASITGDFPSSAVHREVPCLDLPQKFNSGLQVFSTDLAQSTEKRSVFETCSEGLHLEANKKEELPSSFNETGENPVVRLHKQSTDFGGERSTTLEDAELKQAQGQSGSNSVSLPVGFGGDVSTSLEDAKLKQTQEFLRSDLMDQSEKKSYSEGSESLGREISSNSFADTDTSCQLISMTDVGNSEASSVSSWRKHVHDIMRDPIAVQALPCFNTSAPLRIPKISAAIPWLTGQKSDTPSTGFDGLDRDNNDLASEHHFPTKFISLSMEVKPATDDNSNSVSHICSLGREKKLEDLTRGLPWLKTKSLCKRTCGKRSALPTQVESVLERAHLSSIHDVELKKVDASNNSCGKWVQGFQEIYNKPPHMSNGHSSSHLCPLADEYIMIKKDRVTDTNEDADPVIDSQKQPFSNKDVVGGGLHNKISDFGVTIDLNSSMDEHDYSPALSVSTEMDLEVPVSPANKERSPQRLESDENQVERPFQISGKEDEDVHVNLVGNALRATVSGQEGGDMLDELVRTAAKAIVSISSSTVQTCSEPVACELFELCWSDELFELCWSDELYWFAGVASLVVDDPDCEFGVALSCRNSKDNDECRCDGLDYFEAMTLKLTETKVEEQWVNECNDQKNHKEAAAVDTSLLSQMRRGRMRRRRQQQKQDFQSEILPSLASLSRYEVTEDLQTIEGLIEAANYSWGTCPTKNVGRTSWARGRRRTCISTSNSTEISFREKGSVEGKLIGWGKIARRQRGPRCRPSNPWFIKGQVH